MLKRIKNRGSAFFVVLTTIMFVIILANIVMGIMLNQSRLTHHQVSRIRAQYAAQAGMVYTNEMLRLKKWQAVPDGVRYACINACVDQGVHPFDATYLVNDSDIPYNVQIGLSLQNNTGVTNPPYGTTVINIKTDYTYTEPTNP